MRNPFAVATAVVKRAVKKREAKRKKMSSKVVVTPKLMQLYALRSQLEALIVAEELEMAVSEPDPTSCQQCGAPEDKIADASTMSGKRKHCTVCDAEWSA